MRTDYSIYVFGNEQGASIVYNGDTLTAEEKSEGIAVEKLPQEEVIEGKIAILKVNTANKTLYYDYIDSKANANQELEDVKNKLQLMQSALDDMILNGNGGAV